MNGRVQDALSGTFLSPDPFVPDATNTQDFNRYAYVRNNPLTLTDPSGFDPPYYTAHPPTSPPPHLWDCYSTDSPFGPDLYVPGANNADGTSSTAFVIPMIQLYATQAQCYASYPLRAPTDRHLSTADTMVGEWPSADGSACPGGCHSGGFYIPEVTPEVRAATTRFYQNLIEDFIPVAGLYQLGTGRYFFSGDEGSRFFGGLGSLPYLGLAFKEASFVGKAYRLGRPVTLVDSYAWATLSYDHRIATVIRKYGFNLRGRQVVYDARLGTGQLGMTSSLNPNVLRIGAGVMNSEQELAATIAHELRHSRAFMGSGSNSEAAAEAVEQALREYIQGLR